MNTETLAQLAKDARPINESDWGTERQVDAENRFFEEVQKVLGAKQFEKLEDYCLKATTDEAVDYALKLLGAQPQAEATKGR